MKREGWAEGLQRSGGVQQGSCGAEGTCIFWRHWKPCHQKYITFYAYFQPRGERDAFSKDTEM